MARKKEAVDFGQGHAFMATLAAPRGPHPLLPTRPFLEFPSGPNVPGGSYRADVPGMRGMFAYVNPTGDVERRGRGLGAKYRTMGWVEKHGHRLWSRHFDTEQEAMDGTRAAAQRIVMRNHTLRGFGQPANRGDYVTVYRKRRKGELAGHELVIASGILLDFTHYLAPKERIFGDMLVQQAMDKRPGTSNSGPTHFLFGDDIAIEVKWKGHLEWMWKTVNGDGR